MRLQRISNLEELLLAWPFMVDGFKATETAIHEPVDFEGLYRVVTAVVVNPDLGWVGIAVDPFGKSLAFAIAHDATLLYASERSFIVRFAYYLPGRHDAMVFLMRQFEAWARRHSVKRLSVTTKRLSGASVRCFRTRQYGFKKPFLVFEREF